MFLKGAIRPDAVLVPRSAVMQGAKGHFTWVVDEEGKVEFRGVVIGEWHGDSVFISEGLKAGDKVIIDNLIRLAPGVPVRIAEPSAKAGTTGTPSGQNGKAPPAAAGTSPGR